MRLLLLSGLLLSLPALAEDAGTPAPSSSIVIPWGLEEEQRLPLRCGASSGAEVRVAASYAWSGSCDVNQVSQGVEVRGPEGQVWLSFDYSSEDYQPPVHPGLELECRERTLRLRVGRAPALELLPRPEGGVSVGPSLERELTRRLSAPARGQVGEASIMEYLVELVPPSDASASRLHALAHVHAVREQVAAGNWRRVEELRRDSLAAWPDVAAAVREVAHTVEEGRRKSQPLRAQAPRRIGKVLDVPRLAPHGPPGLFWRGRELCMSQQDAAGQLRCYDTTSHRWGELEPVPQSLSERFLSFEPGSCGGFTCLGEVCAGGTASTVSFLGRVVDGQLVYFSDGHGHWRAGERALSPKEVSAEFARGVGGPVLGGGRYLTTKGDFFIPTNPKDARSWHLFSAPPPEPEGGTWEAVLVSPDQRQVAALSRGGTSKPEYVLWVASIAPGKAP
ncbi:hypothetical protein F0U60_33310 [Archangium minus]|uniref:Uncharacterized protein n=1 Tax=Archangium minus TaxID=83450 RepID=A0ABY9WZ75_9BACT|nr:hypothetical protein F0U60_33310 [Archangium minus]